MSQMTRESDHQFDSRVDSRVGSPVGLASQITSWTQMSNHKFDSNSQITSLNRESDHQFDSRVDWPPLADANTNHRFWPMQWPPSRQHLIITKAF